MKSVLTLTIALILCQYSKSQIDVSDRILNWCLNLPYNCKNEYHYESRMPYFCKWKFKDCIQTPEQNFPDEIFGLIEHGKIGSTKPPTKETPTPGKTLTPLEIKILTKVYPAGMFPPTKYPPPKNICDKHPYKMHPSCLARFLPKETRERLTNKLLCQQKIEKELSEKNQQNNYILAQPYRSSVGFGYPKNPCTGDFQKLTIWEAETMNSGQVMCVYHDLPQGIDQKAYIRWCQTSGTLDCKVCKPMKQPLLVAVWNSESSITALENAVFSTGDLAFPTFAYVKTDCILSDP